MNIFIDVLFLFIYLTLLFYFKIPDITNNNYIFHTIVIFILILAFNYVMETIKKIRNKCKIDLGKVFNIAIDNSLYGIIGYSLYVYLMYTDLSCVCDFKPISDDNARFVFVSSIISFFMLFVNCIKSVFATGNEIC